MDFPEIIIFGIILSACASVPTHAHVTASYAFLLFCCNTLETGATLERKTVLFNMNVYCVTITPSRFAH